MLGKMSGVVLWADKCDGKAVIWCEDQGDLAYFTSGDLTDTHSGTMLDAGDLIMFDIEQKSNIRLAYRPELINSGHAPELAQSLPMATANTKVAKKSVNSPSRSVTDNVVPFPAFA